MSLSNDGYMEEFPKNFTQFSMKKLCEIVVTAQYLGSMNEEAIMCMEELAQRRVNGDTFEYELFIEAELKKLPDFKFSIKQKMQVGFDLSVLRGIK